VTGERKGGRGGRAGAGAVGGGSTTRGPSGRGSRDPAVRVRAQGRTTSQQRWLTRQLNDPYVAEAKRRGLRSRAAFKLIELDDRLRLLRPGMTVVDLGAAPGGWTQVVVDRVRGGRVVALDILAMDAIPGAETIEMDFLDEGAPARLREAMGGGADLVLSDMAASATGHGPTDHLRIVGLAEAAHAFAREVLKPGGGFVCKVFQGGTEGALLNALKQDFAEVRHIKPPASRADSAEVYVIARGFRGEHG
jgi:23S rRNA (uridine2552-2'-O)-methyltransferase